MATFTTINSDEYTHVFNTVTLTEDDVVKGAVVAIMIKKVDEKGEYYDEIVNVEFEAMPDGELFVTARECANPDTGWSNAYPEYFDFE